jgi:hypothetical protein
MEPGLEGNRPGRLNSPTILGHTRGDLTPVPPPRYNFELENHLVSLDHCLNWPYNCGRI